MRFSAILLVLTLGHLTAADGPAQGGFAAATERTGVRAGLAVLVGTPQIDDVITLAKPGSLLVECLVDDPSQVGSLRRGVADAGLAGLVTVSVRKPGALPYVAASVTLLAADLTRADAPPAAEITRVMAPYGATWLRTTGGWSAATVAMAPEMDEWPQINNRADQSAWSRDRLAGPPSAFRWLAPVPAVSGLGAGKVPLRIAGGRMVCFVPDGKGRGELEARDAGNGLRLWSVPAELEMGGSNNDTHCGWLLANRDRVYAYLNRTGPLTCLDARTGAVLRTLEGPARAPLPPRPANNRDQETQWRIQVQANIDTMRRAQVIEDGGRLVSLIDGTITVYDEPTGKRLWTRTLPDARYALGAVAGERVVIMAQGASMTMPTHRGVDFTTGAGYLAAFAMGDGKPLWRVDDLVDEGIGSAYMPPQIFRDRVVLSLKRVQLDGTKTAAPNTTLPAGWIYGAYDLATGKRLWRDGTADAKGSIPARVWWISGSWINGAGELWTGYVGQTWGIDTATGKLVRQGNVAGDNCFWTRGIGDWYTAGPFWMHTTSLQVASGGGVRTGCNDGVYAAYGAVFTNNHNGCSCNTFLLARAAMVSDPLPKGIDDGQRLETMAPVTPTPAAAGGWPTFLATPRRTSVASGLLPAKPVLAWRATLAPPLPEGPVAADWRNDATVRRLTPPVMEDGVLVVGKVQEHQVVALDAKTGAVRWQTTLGGRIDSPPTLWRGHVYAGCRDGHVYCLSLADGSVRWRSLLATDRRRIVHAGQLESAWPVLGSTLVHDGALYACGGRTSQYDGGLWVVKLDPLTGKQSWRSRILSAPDWENAVVNELLAVVDGRVWMGKVSLDTVTGAVIDEVAARYPATLKRPRRDVEPVPDPRTALTNTGANSWWRGPGGRGASMLPFPGFGGSYMSMMWPGARTNHRGDTCGHWATDERQHVRLGSGAFGRKGNDGSMAGLVAYAADVQATGRKDGPPPLWRANTRHVAAMTMDEARVLLVESGNNSWGTTFYEPPQSQPGLVLISRADGTPAGERIPLPAPVVWRGIAAAAGMVWLVHDDGSVSAWR